MSDHDDAHRDTGEPIYDPGGNVLGYRPARCYCADCGQEPAGKYGLCDTCLPPALVYTKKTPTESGQYWLDDNGEEDVVYVNAKNGDYLAQGNEHYLPLNSVSVNARWAGPLLAPKKSGMKVSQRV